MLGISLAMLIGSALLMLRLSPGGSFPSPLSQEEEKKYLTQWQNGDIFARNVLVEHNLRLVAHIIKKYYTQTNDIEDLMHFDEDYASKTQFGRCIAHGVISLSLCGSVLGMELPGLGTIHMGQEVTFKKPVYPGDTITAHCEIIDIQYKEKKDFYIVKVKQWVTNQNGDVVTEGIATCMPPKA